VQAVAVGAVGSQAVQVLILERGRGLTYTPRRESRFRGPRSIDRFAAVLEPRAQFGETFAAILLKILALKLTHSFEFVLAGGDLAARSPFAAGRADTAHWTPGSGTWPGIAPKGEGLPRRWQPFGSSLTVRTAGYLGAREINGAPAVPLKPAHARVVPSRDEPIPPIHLRLQRAT
jgi:hypothetical protein